MMTNAMVDTIGATMLDRGVALCNAVMFGDWDAVGRALDRELHVVHAAVLAQSGAADEVEFYGGAE